MKKEPEARATYAELLVSCQTSMWFLSSHLLNRSTRSLLRIVHGQLTWRAGLHVHLSIEIKHNHPCQNQISDRTFAVFFSVLFSVYLGFYLSRSPSPSCFMLHLAPLAECGPVSISTFRFPKVFEYFRPDLHRHFPHTRRRTIHDLPSSVLSSFYNAHRKNP
jgi:hypothetical protein